MSRLIQDFKILTPAERSLWRHPMMWLSAAAIAVVPLLYAGIYLGSAIDPYGNLKNLPVALVNLDKGTQSRGETVRLGAEVVDDLRADPKFNYLSYPSEAAAQEAVRRGDAYFSLTLPRDFSAKAVEGDSSSHGLLKFYVSEGGSYFASRVASTFADTLSDELNRTLGENRWEVVGDSLKDVQKGFADIRTATGKLRDGAATLEDGTKALKDGATELATGAKAAANGGAQLTEGAKSLSSGVGRLTDGSAQLSSGLRQLEAAAPGQAQLAPLQTGVGQLQSGTAQLSAGLTQLSDGASALSAGAKSANAGAAQLAGGSKELASKLPQLQTGLGQLSDGADQLSTGAKAANAGAGKVAAGNKQLAGGLKELSGGLQQATDGANKLNQGAAELATGTKTLNESVKDQALLPGELKGGIAQINSGATGVHAGSNSLSNALPKLADGAQKAAVSAGQLATGANDLAAGTAKVQSGAASLATGLKDASAASAAAVKGARQLSAGAVQLTTGTAQLQSGAATLAQKSNEAAKGAAELSAGATSLQGGVNTLVDGNLKIKDALGQITAQLPAQGDLNNLENGASTLAQKSGELRNGLNTLSRGATKLQTGATDLDAGAVKLRDGLDTLYSKIPADTEGLGGDPAGLSASVLPVTEKFAPVKNNGAGFAPYFMALSLWVGVTLTTFIFPYSQLPRSGRGTSQFARMLRKAAVPAALVCVQALLVVWGVHALGVEFLHPAQVIATALASSLTFLTLVLALIFLFGAAGRLIALVLLVLQLAASGGSYPVELSPPFFGAIHNFVPVTQSVNAFRHALSGAFQGSYVTFMLVLLGIAVLSVGAGLLGRRRWEVVADEDFKPLITSPLVSEEVHHEREELARG
ncbi:YhgE/Pip family protein [Deinococcus radiopugnans]|uniref:Membrane protein n=1 Tax=Deinococcus radiopugnans ATCC 19172 TaxID=585398 RepID=A0A5C4Y6P0_9DEIO|nr:YhgE/Pip domain-containing protein [Deinococcus radiopugnans]MBB6016307.1 putative membrane protein [Deinococcus radiopugnans ATCC 19172]TNM71276.1 YhgE/Pip domain-containing protein [Deinococcus radiopugnans ATCC 19172]